ncbi:MFS transporter [Burkholderia stagnalis]|uniref:MFS transporter n=1 Tax=Burkholderia stagnalis TaxID=1503054 RepID=UPI00075A7815|nr:MFS transporter [Burkholderia stagnalis]KVD96203.1 MFS transporter [Burkholderia stagnalis]KVX55396.1 MFS transporter [Burkholderia stagnalis]
MSIVFDADTRSAQSLYRKIDRRVLAFLAVCYAVAYIDRVNIGFAKLQMQQDLALSDAAYGFGAGIFFLGYMLFEIPSNQLLTRIGARKTLSRIMLLWGIASMSMFLVTDATSFYVVRFLLGVFEAGFAPGMLFYLTRWYPRERLSRAMALLLCAAPLGGIVAAPVSGWLLEHMKDVAGLAGWQWMFLIEGVPALLLGLIALTWLSDAPQDARWLTADEKQAVIEQCGTDRSTPERWSALKTVLRDAGIYRLSAVYFCLICGVYVVGFWLPSILKASGVNSIVAIGWYSAIPYAAAIAGMYWLARRSDRTLERRRHAGIAAAAGAGVLTVAALFVDRFGVAIVAITIATALTYAAYAVFWAIPAEYLRSSVAATGIAFVNTVGLLGGFLSPTIIGTLKSISGSTSAGLFVIVGLLALGALLLLIRPIRSTEAVRT